MFGYETATYRKVSGLPKTHRVDALCIATLYNGEVVPEQCENVYTIRFRPRQTRRQYHSLPRKGQGRIRYQVHKELGGFRKGDIIQVKGRWVKQINAIYTEGRLALQRVKGEPLTALPKDCRLLERGRTVVWQQVV